MSDDTGAKKALALLNPDNGQDTTKVSNHERMSSMNPEIQRMSGIIKLMSGEGTLSRVSREQIILEALVDGAIDLGYNLKGIKTLIRSARDLSPGLDGLARGEAVKCLVAHAQSGAYYAASPFPEPPPGMIARFLSFFMGKKSEQQQPR